MNTLSGSSKKQRQLRVRSRLRGTPERPRASVFRSNKHIYAQIIDDDKEHTLAAASDLQLTKRDSRKTDAAFAVGKELAKKAKEAGVKKVVFDRGPYKYHGRVKALAEGLRAGGINF